MSDNIKKTMSFDRIILIILILVAILFPLVCSKNYIVGVGVNCFIFAALGIAWNIISGYGGQISWCHAAFVAIGAYTGFIFKNFFNLSPFISLLPAMAISYLAATLIGNVVFRYRGPFFAISTIAFAELLRVLLQYWAEVTGGASGMNIVYLGQDPLNLMFKTNTPFYYIMLIVLLAMLGIMYKIEHSRLGYALSAIKGNEDAAQALGIDTKRVKIQAFQISAAATSAIGVFYAFYLTFIDPKSICGLDLSVKIGACVILGGLGTFYGPVLGAFVIVPLIEISSVLLGAEGGTQLLYGLALVLVMIFQPQGLINLFRKSKSGRAEDLLLSSSLTDGKTIKKDEGKI